MRRDIAAKRYAQAVFDIAASEGALERWTDDVKAIADLMTHPDIAATFENARIPREVKYRLLDTALAGMNPLAVNFAKLLVEKGRTAIAGQVWEELRGLVWQQQGLAHAQVVTAVPLSPDEVETLAARLSQLTGQQVVVETQVSPDILGGLVARIGDRLIDGSTKGKLLALKKTLTDTAR